MPWWEEPVLAYVWAALIALLAVGFLGLDPILRDLAYVLTLLHVPPAVASAASQTAPLRGRPRRAFLMGFLTYTATPFAWFRGRPPYNAVMLALAALWGLACALLAASRRPWDLRALPAYAALFLLWWYGLSLLMD